MMKYRPMQYIFYSEFEIHIITEIANIGVKSGYNQHHIEWDFNTAWLVI
jgi:hypothetical protein